MSKILGGAAFSKKTYHSGRQWAQWVQRGRVRSRIINVYIDPGLSQRPPPWDSSSVPLKEFSLTFFPFWVEGSVGRVQD